MSLGIQPTPGSYTSTIPPTGTGFPSGDHIDSLPVDNNPPNEREHSILMNDLKFAQSQASSIASSFKTPLLTGALFFVLSLPATDRLICHVAPVCQEMPYVLLLIKSLIFMVMFFVISKFNLFMK